MLKFKRYFYIESNANKGVALCHGYVYTLDGVAIVTWRPPMDEGKPSPQRHERHDSIDALLETFEDATVVWYD